MAQGIAPLTLEELALFNEFLSSRFGLIFPEHKREILDSRLEPRLRCHHVHRYIDYYLLLQYDLERELDPLTRAMTNNESYFFRELAQLEALEGERVAELMTGGVRGELQILSAGCSAGEEPYSINIQVRSAALGLLADNLRIDAIDIDSERFADGAPGDLPAALAAHPVGGADRALLHPPRARGLRAPPDLPPRRPFHPRQHPRPRTWPETPGYDVVFCRNVLIYFSEAALKTAIETFARVVRPGGLLFLGHSESIIGLTQAFQVERLGQCIAYRRRRS